MIGVDLSADMLSQAAQKRRDGAEIAPLFLCQSMDRLDLYGTVDACVCCLDSVNYVTDREKLQRAFDRVHLFLMPGGLFIFDARSPESLKSLDSQVFLDETEDAYCVWRAEYSARRGLCTYCMDLFRREQDGRWNRSKELHKQRAYSPEELCDMLRLASFRSIRQYGHLKKRAPQPGEERIFFVAEKEG